MRWGQVYSIVIVYTLCIMLPNRLKMPYLAPLHIDIEYTHTEFSMWGRQDIFVLYGNFTSKDAIENYEAFQVVKMVKILYSKDSKRETGINEWPLWEENTSHFQQFQSTKTFIYTVKHLRVTSMLMTDVWDQMCWWQVWDVGDRFRILVTDLIHWENHHITKKSPT